MQRLQIALTHFFSDFYEYHHLFSCCSLQSQTPETEVKKKKRLILIYMHRYSSNPCYFPLVPVTCSYIILFVYLFSLCLTALYSCSTEERGAEDFVCMEMNVAALWGNVQRAELFDAWPSVECWDFAVKQLRRKEKQREEPG